MRTYLLSLLLIVLIAGCKSFDSQLLRPEAPLQSRIPSLVVQVDQAGLEAAYTLGEVQSGSSEYKFPVGEKARVTIGAASSITLQDKRIQHAVVLFEREISDNICEIGGKKYGYAVCRIADRKSTLGWGWILPSGLTVFLINLLGFPLYSETTELDVEVEILDRDNNRVGKYSALAEDTKYCAVYWGYRGTFLPSVGADTDNELTRTTNAYALRKALEDIKGQIARDSERITMRLHEMGGLDR